MGGKELVNQSINELMAKLYVEQPLELPGSAKKYQLFQIPFIYYMVEKGGSFKLENPTSLKLRFNFLALH